MYLVGVGVGTACAKAQGPHGAVWAAGQPDRGAHYQPWREPGQGFRGQMTNQALSHQPAMGGCSACEAWGRLAHLPAWR